MNKIYILLLGLLIPLVITAQNFVTGIVTDGEEPLIGVTVSVKGRESQGTTTDLDGNYKIQAKSNEVLKFSYIGHQAVEESVKNRQKINIVLKSLSHELDELVITVPYGVVKKSTFTGSAGYVDKKLIEKSQSSNVAQALQGTVAGLQTFSPAGQPGSDPEIRIRGIGSANASSSPLIVLDGVPYEGNLSSISTSDIESITVLKDAASATLYGSRAANGVIMITTKIGRKNTAPQIDINTKFGFSDLARRDYDQLNTNEYFELFWEAVRNNRIDNKYTPENAANYASENLAKMIGINPYGIDNPQPVGLDGKLLSGLNPLWDDNWLDALTRNAHYTSVDLQVSGGTSNTNYFVSGSFLDNQGAFIGSGFKRYTLRTNLVTDIKPWLQVGVNLSGTHSIQDFPKQDDSEQSNVILFSRGMPSFYPIYKRNLQTGEYLVDESGNRMFDYGEYRASSYARYNLLGSMPYDKNERKVDAISTRAYVQITPIKELTFKSSMNLDYTSLFRHDYSNPIYGPSAETGGSVTKYNRRKTNFTFNNILTFNKEYNKLHKLKVLGGQEYYEFNSSYFEGTREGMVLGGMYEPDAGALLSGFNGNSDQYKLLSFLGSIDYSFKDRYFLSTSFRTDGSSRFHPDNRWGTFWSIGGSWKASEENFFKSVREKWLSNLTLRASYGGQGNDNIGYYAYQELYSIQNNLGESGLIMSRLGTPSLSWETNLNLNIGLDFGFFDNRLNGSVEFFERRSKDLLFNRQLIPSTGFSSVSENVGTIKNYGWEFLIQGSPIQTKDWGLKLSFNATTYKNKIVKIPYSEIWDGSKKWVEGGSLFDFYMVEWAGVNPENGSAQWYRYDSEGNKIITEDFSSTSIKDKIKAGSALPDLTGGFQTDLTFRGFNLSTFFSYAIGGKIYNRDKQSIQHLGSAGRSWSKDMLNRWTPENRNSDIPRLTTQPKSSWLNESTRFLIDRSFLKLKNVTLSYNLPKSWISKWGINNTSIFVQGENLFILTKEQGLDPEQTFAGTTYYRYPSMKTVSFGLNVKL